MSRKSIAFAAALLAWGVFSVGMLPRAVAQIAEKPTTKPRLQIGGDSSAEQKLRVALDDKTNLEFTTVPLVEALKYIAEKHHIDIQYDVVALRDAAIDPTAIPVTFNVNDVRVGSALKLLLAENNLTYVLQDEVVLITTKDKASTTLTTVVYDVRDLLSASDAQQADFSRLISLLTTTIAAQTWSEAGGPGTITGFGPGSLVVLQTLEVHEQVNDLLNYVRGVAAEMKSGKMQDSVLNGRAASNPKFDRVLAQKKSLDANDLTLFQALAELFKSQPISVVYDQAALRDAAVDLASLNVTANFRGTKLGSILWMLLSQHNLTYVLQDDVLLVTTKDKAATTMVRRIYPVNDLLRTSSNDLPSADDARAGIKALIDALTNAVAPQTWSEVGGPGTIEAFDKDGIMLVVSQTPEVHDGLSALLKNLRTMHDQQLAAAAHEESQPKAPETVVLKVYDLRASSPNSPAMTPQEVMDVVKGLVEPKSWSSPDVYIRGATGKLIVKQLPSVQRQVEKLLDQLGAAVPKITTGGRGGAGLGGNLRAGGSF